MTTFINLNETPDADLRFTKAGHYVVFMHNRSGKVAVELDAPGVEVDIFGLYTARGDDIYAIETVQHHKAPGATSNLLIKGVFDDRSKFNYQGLIRIEKPAQQSHAYQKNQNIIVSPHTFVESKPYLEILANDVFCTHGSTTGKLNAEELFYAESRGLDRQAARRLLIDGFIGELFDKVIEKVPGFTPPGL